MAERILALGEKGKHQCDRCLQLFDFVGNGKWIPTTCPTCSQRADQDHPKFPAPKFNIGDWAIYVGDDTEDDEKAYCVVGLSLDFYHFSGRFTWYYDFGDNFNGCVVAGEGGDDWQPADPDPDRSPYPAVTQCWNCQKIRVDDGLACVECGADPVPVD